VPIRTFAAVSATAALALAAFATGAGSSQAVPVGPATTAATSARILFDNGHAETAGNADWIISTAQPDPFVQKASPLVEKDWTGAISAWGVSLAQNRVKYPTLRTSTTALTYGNTGNALDLKNFEELVIPEPNTAFTTAERTAIMLFVQNGGGLFLIVDHDQSDRNNDGVDSVDIANQLFTSNGVNNNNPFGLAVDYLNISSENPNNIPSSAATHPVISGPWGTANGSILRGGTTFTISTASNPNAKCLLYRNTFSNTGSTGCFFAVSQFGLGRVALWGDSSPVDDGTGQAGNNLFYGWTDPLGTDATFALNATDWLAKLS